MNNNLTAIKSIAQVLGEINDDVVFVGGATVELYINDKAAPVPQPSEDVDCIVEVLTYGQWLQFEEKLRAKGFQDFDVSGEDTKPPSCRKYILGMKVDFMPIEERVLGYGNKWFKEGVEKSIKIDIDGIEIKILKLEFFLATKLQAFFDRGIKNDIRFSQDLEDITELFDGVVDIESCILNTETILKEDIVDKLKILVMRKDEFEEAMMGFLGYDNSTVKVKRVERIFEILLRLISS